MTDYACKEWWIVFDGPPSHDSGRFVEVVDQYNRSGRPAEWKDRGDGFWQLVPFPDPAVRQKRSGAGPIRPCSTR